MNCVLHLNPHLHLRRNALPFQFLPPSAPPSPKLQSPTSLSSPTPPPSTISTTISTTNSNLPIPKEKAQLASPAELPRWVFIGGASLGVALLLMGMDPDHRALALGPEGPLMEEFWDNVRRYVLYALTVSTGAVYTISQPIIELLKNPITAILIIVLLAGTFYLLSQVLSAMIGVSEFSYDYAY